MAALPLDRLAALLEPFVAGAPVPPNLYTQLSGYLDLLVRWNGRTNLTAIREPEEIVQRHFGESVFAGLQLLQYAPGAVTVLDFGSGAGFPGLPMQLAVPQLRVTLAESQGKKAAFLRETVRVLGVPTILWPRRVESMPDDQRFDVVAMRAVDKMDEAIPLAQARVAAGGRLLILGGTALADSFPGAKVIDVPVSAHRKLVISA